MQGYGLVIIVSLNGEEDEGKVPDDDVDDDFNDSGAQQQQEQ